MAKQQKKVPGVQWVGKGLRARVRIKGVLYTSPVFPADTHLSVLKTWITNRRHDHDHKPGTSHVDASFVEDVARYLELRSDMKGIDDRRRDMAYWVEALGGHRRRDTITRDEIKLQLNAWRTRYAASTVNHRRYALQNFFTVIAPNDLNPLATLKGFDPPDLPAKHLTYPTIRKIFREMGPSVAKARLVLMAYTGIPPAMQNAITPNMVDWKAGHLWVPKREKAKGVEARKRPLTRPGLVAFRYVRRLSAWGHVDSMNMNMPWYRGVRKAADRYPEVAAEVGPRKDVARGLYRYPLANPYALRHSFATWCYEHTAGDIQKTADFCGHADTKTTLRYVKGAVDLVRQRTANSLSEIARKEHLASKRSAAKTAEPSRSSNPKI